MSKLFDSYGGVLPSQEIKALIEKGFITSQPDKVNPSSLDLTIGEEAYWMKGSYLPFQGEKIKDLIRKGKIHLHDLREPLNQDGIFLISIDTKIKLPKKLSLFQGANNKSSSGRINLQGKLVADRVARFDRLPEGFEGRMWLEVSPRSFVVKINKGDCINQMRFFPSNFMPWGYQDYKRHYEKERLLLDKDGKLIDIERGCDGKSLIMHLDLQSFDVVGYRAQSSNKVLDFSKIRAHKREDFFEPISRPSNGEMMLKKGVLYILHTQEYIRIPNFASVEMVPIDVGIGDFRSHYAGYFDPGFGYGNNGELRGNNAVLEVISHENDIVLRHDQPICRMAYEYLSQETDIPYGTASGSNYTRQEGPVLSKHFI